MNKTPVKPVADVDLPSASFEWRPMIVSSLFLLTLFIYLGSYFALAENDGPLQMCSDGLCRHRVYRRGGRTAEVVFYPVHTIDVFARPTHWGVSP